MSYTHDQIKTLTDIKAQNKANLEAHISSAKDVNLFELMIADGYTLKPVGVNKSGFTQYEIVESGHRTGNLFVDPLSMTWVYVEKGCNVSVQRDRLSLAL